MKLLKDIEIPKSIPYQTALQHAAILPQYLKEKEQTKRELHEAQGSSLPIRLITRPFCFCQQRIFDILGGP